MVKKSLCADCDRKVIARHHYIAGSMADIIDDNKSEPYLSGDMMDAMVRMFLYHIEMSWYARLCNKCRYGT
jgi:hypothetical protein